MRQTKKREKDKVAIVLMLCFCVIALTSILTIKSNVDKIKDNSQQILVSEETSSDSKTASNKNSYKESEETQDYEAEKISLNDSESNEVSSSAVIDSLSAEQENHSSEIYIYPVSASDCFVTNPFSMDSLIYSVTLDQYMVHCGTDIQADSGSNVLAMADGTVTSIYVDDRYGNSVEISHGNNLVSIYSNLSDAKMVEVGDTVTAGDIIGNIGNTGLFESLESPHLHMEVLENGIYVNPEDYICNNH